MIDAAGREPRTTARKIGYLVIGLLCALIVGPLFIFGAYTIVASVVGL